MRRLAILLAGAALLAGCAAPAVPEAASAVQAVSSEAGTGHAGSRTEQLAVLDGLVDFGADTVGCSLKTARAAAVLVEYLSASELEDGTADTWRAGLSGDAQERLALNWPGILAEAQAMPTPRPVPMSWRPRAWRRISPVWSWAVCRIS